MESYLLILGLDWDLIAFLQEKALVKCLGAELEQLSLKGGILLAAEGLIESPVPKIGGIARSDFPKISTLEPYCLRVCLTCSAMRSRKVLPSFTSSKLLAFSKPMEVPKPPFSLKTAVCDNKVCISKSALGLLWAWHTWLASINLSVSFPMHISHRHPHETRDMLQSPKQIFRPSLCYENAQLLGRHPGLLLKLLSNDRPGHASATGDNKAHWHGRQMMRRLPSSQHHCSSALLGKGGRR